MNLRKDWLSLKETQPHLRIRDAATQLNVSELQLAATDIGQGAARLREIVNAGGFGVEDPVVQALGGTLAAAVGDRVLALEVPFSRNVALIVRRDHPLPAPGGDAWTQVAAFAEPLIRSWAAPGTWAWIEAAETPLSDAHAPLEALQRESISAGRRRWGTSP